MEKSVAKILERNAVVQILSLTYFSIEHSFAGHMHGFTNLEYETYYDGNPKTQLILEILHYQKSYSLILHFFGNISDYYIFKKFP